MAKRTRQLRAFIAERLLPVTLLAGGASCTAITAGASYLANVLIGGSAAALLYFGNAAVAIDVLGGTYFGLVAGVLFRIGRPVLGTVLGTMALAAMAYSALSFFALLLSAAPPHATAKHLFIAAALELEPDRVRLLDFAFLATLLTTLKIICLFFGVWLWPRGYRRGSYETDHNVDTNAVPVSNTAHELAGASSIRQVQLAGEALAHRSAEPLIEYSHSADGLIVDAVSNADGTVVDRAVGPAEEDREASPLKIPAAPGEQAPQRSAAGDRITTSRTSFRAPTHQPGQHRRANNAVRAGNTADKPGGHSADERLHAVGAPADGPVKPKRSRGSDGLIVGTALAGRTPQLIASGGRTTTTRTSILAPTRRHLSRWVVKLFKAIKMLCSVLGTSARPRLRPTRFHGSARRAVHKDAVRTRNRAYKAVGEHPADERSLSVGAPADGPAEPERSHGSNGLIVGAYQANDHPSE